MFQGIGRSKDVLSPCLNFPVLPVDSCRHLLPRREVNWQQNLLLLGNMSCEWTFVFATNELSKRDGHVRKETINARGHEE